MISPVSRSHIFTGLLHFATDAAERFLAFAFASSGFSSAHAFNDSDLFFELQVSFEPLIVLPASLCTLLDELQSTFDVPVSFSLLPLVFAVPFDCFHVTAGTLPGAHAASGGYAHSSSPGSGHRT